MATGLIGEKAGSQPREPRQLQRPQPGQPRRPRPGRAAELPRSRPADQPVPGGGRGAPAAVPVPQRAAAARQRVRSRTPFVLLLIGLLGGGLVCLLLINTTLAQGSFQITAMQHKNADLAQQEQALQQQITQEQSPASIAERARQLGMRPTGRLRFIDLKTGRIFSQPAHVPGVIPVPGYTP
jgi:cell division protein FtsB